MNQLLSATMPPKGKGPAAAAAADDDSDDSDDDMATAPLAGREAQWQAGGRRQALPQAREHQVAAGQASGAKRKANAMSKEESLLRKAAHKREVRAQKAAALKETRERQRAERAAVISASESSCSCHSRATTAAGNASCL